MLRRLISLFVVDVTPLAKGAIFVFLTAREQRFLGRLRCPLNQAIRQTRGVGGQGLGCGKVRDAVGLLTQVDLGHTKIKFAEFCCVHGWYGPLFYCLLTLAARPSRKSRTRCLASGAACAIADIMDSVMKP